MPKSQQHSDPSHPGLGLQDDRWDENGDHQVGEWGQGGEEEWGGEEYHQQHQQQLLLQQQQLEQQQSHLQQHQLQFQNLPYVQNQWSQLQNQMFSQLSTQPQFNQYQQQFVQPQQFMQQQQQLQNQMFSQLSTQPQFNQQQQVPSPTQDHAAAVALARSVHTLPYVRIPSDSKDGNIGTIRQKLYQVKCCSNCGLPTTKPAGVNLHPEAAGPQCSNTSFFVLQATQVMCNV